MSWFLGCTDGMTLGQAASIGMGVASMACGVCVTAVLAVEAWHARRAGEEEGERPTPNAQRSTPKFSERDAE